MKTKQAEENEYKKLDKKVQERTVELRKTNNIWCVMKLLGHKSLSNTQKYIHLLGDLSSEYVAAVAHNAQEAVKLIEAGYTFVQTIGEEHLYRKLK